VHFSELIQALLNNTWPLSLKLFGPELILCATIVVLLLVRVLKWQKCLPAVLLALAGALAALWVAVPWNAFSGSGIARTEIFTGLLVFDTFTVYFRSLLLVFAVLFIVMTWLSGIPDREDAADIYSLVLGGLIGMCLMASANHILMIFLAVEMASVPSYALTGLLKGRRQSSEAALKYAVYGAGAAGVMLYGLSLLAGVLGSCHLPTMAGQLAEMLSAGSLGGKQVVLALGGLMLGVGLCFKLSAVPFHFWCPDVFEGAAAEVNAYLSVASKAGALALLVRVTLGLGYVVNPTPPATTQPALAAYNVADEHATKSAVKEATPAQPSPASPAAVKEEPNRALEPVRKFMALVVAFIAAITCTFGNLAAYGQTNIKRLFAYSTIAHAGYMMMPVAAALLLAGSFPRDAELAISTIVFYIALYLFMNLGAFAIVAFLRNTLRSEEIADYAGLIRRSPGVVICFSVILFSLVGLPPLAGFVGKFALFTALVTAIKQNVGASAMLTLLVIAGLNTVISLFYYLRVVKVMALDAEPERRAPSEFSLVSLPGAYVVLITLPVLALGFWFNDLLELARSAAAHLLS